MLAKKQHPLISIITPSYNMGSFLEQCIKSVLNQDYPYVEHIIHDGMSSDNTKNILKKYHNKKYEQRIKISCEIDKGQADGLNKAIQRSKGDILLVLNADDILMPYACSWAVANFNLFPDMAVIYGDVFIIDKKGKIIKIARATDYNYERLFCVELVPPAQAAFIQRSFFSKAGLYADATLDSCPDFEMWVRIGMKFPMKYIPGIISQYRAYPHTDSHAPRSSLRFYHAKKSVIDRVIKAPKTPQSIKSLKNRAYSGLNLWTAHEAFGENKFRLGANLIISSLFYYPSYTSFKRVFSVWLDSPLLFIRALLHI